MKMRRFIIGFCCCTGLFLSSFVAHAEESQVVVSATGKVAVKPDMAEFGVVIISDAKTADKAAADTAERYRMVQNALRTAGIPLEDAPTAAYTVAPRWEWEQSLGKNVLKGYSARHTIMVKVHSLGSTGRAIDAAVQAGATEVQNVSFSSSSYEVLRQQALVAAVSNARKDASIMAQAAGGALGQLIEVTVSQPIYGDRPFMEPMALRASPAQAPTEIAPSEQDIIVTVNSRWRFIGSQVFK
ncbi:MAG: DUF541 domain-containing protein [Chlorobium sp.]|nr:MAG: DUF541 domain-containing protein [Chlorobium sp.]